MNQEQPRRSPRDSQEALALSIARAVQLGLPAPDSEEAIRQSVEQALLSEARDNERLLAYIRAGVLGVATLLAAVTYRSPRAFGLRDFDLWALLAVAAAAAVAGGFALVLRRGWYERRLTRVVPTVDALGIVVGFVLFEQALGRIGDTAAPFGSFSAAAVACAFLAVSGSLRLSRPAARLATVLAIGAWLGVWVVGRPPWAASILIGVLIVAMGALAGRVTRIIRGVIKDEILRIRLLELYRNAQEAIDAREEVLNIVAHDLRNPLNNIALATEMLLDDEVPEAKRERHLRLIRRQGERMERLVCDLLDAARLESGRLSIARTAVEVPSIVDSAIEMMGPLAEEKHLHLRSTVPDGLPLVWADSERICQVFSNLIGNAIKFTPAEGHITLGASRMGASVRFSVSDTGPGIPPDQLSEIFKNMWQANKDDARGIGLGLTIAKAIVEAHGERIGVESRVGEGTEFWFTVPTIDVAGK